MIRAPIFDAIRIARKGRRFTPDEVQLVDLMLDRLNVPITEDPPLSDMARRISPKGLALVKVSEGLRLKAYRDAVGVLTIGYGSTGKHVKEGMVITEAQAEKLLRDDLDRFERHVSKVGGHMTQGQFDALVSFAFNLGEKALSDSTLLKLHKAEDFEGAANQFQRWVKAGGKTLPGLVTRRAAEAAMYRGQG